MQETVIVVFVTLAVVGIAYVTSCSLRRWLEFRNKQAEIAALSARITANAAAALRVSAEDIHASCASIQAAKDAIDKVGESYRGIAENLQNVPKLLEGIISVTKEEVQQLDRMTEAIETFRHVVFPNQSEAGTALLEYSARDADREYEISQLMRSHGMSREDAEGRVKSKSLWGNFKVTP